MVTITTDQFQPEFQQARDAVTAANAVRTPCWSLYLFVYSNNCSYDQTSAQFIHQSCHPSQAAAIAASQAIDGSRAVDPIWFVVEEILAADGKRYETDGSEIYEETVNRIICRYNVECGVFSGFLWPGRWMPYYRALGGYSDRLHLLFVGNEPTDWNTQVADEYDIEWGISHTY